jgi:FkbM family methyltransferase
MAHATRALARMIPSWQEMPLEGPDGLPLHIDLRQVEGYFSNGYANTLGHAEPVLSRLRDGDVVVDLGANVGVWSRAALARANLSRLYAFEPAGRSAELLDLNLHPYPHASCEPYAVGDSDGRVAFTTNLGSVLNHVTQPGRRTKTVQMVALDNWAQRAGLERLDLMKIDVEGYEPAALRGAWNTISTYRPTIAIEWAPEHPRTALAMLEGIGYQLQAIALDGTLLPPDTDAIHSNDFLATPR